MKKLLALVLALVMTLSMGSVLAEDLPIETIEQLYDGAWVQFEDGFEIYLPADWVEFETTPEMNAGGIFYLCGTEDAEYTCAMTWSPLEAECTVEEAHQELAAAYPGAELVEVNGIALIVFGDAENDQLTFAALDATEPGVYLFIFTPMSDENFRVLASAIAASLRITETAL